MKITAEPRSDQWNADDFIGGPRTFIIAGVKTGTAEQKYDIALVEGEGRAWRPPLTILRVLVDLWGDDSPAWQGRRVTLYRDASVRFGKDTPGGIRVSHMSDIGGKTRKVLVTTSRGRRAPYTVEPLPDSAPQAPADPEGIPQHVRETVESITDPGVLADYLAHIAEQGAPAHIIEWVNAQNKEA